MTVAEKIEELSCGKKIKVLRTSKGLTLQQLADTVGTTKKNVWLWESERTKPNGASRKMICNVLGVSEEELFKKEDKH